MSKVVEFHKRPQRRPSNSRHRVGSPSHRRYSSPLASFVLVLGGFLILFLLTRGPTGTGASFDTDFSICTQSPHDNCVVDGDTFYFQHQSIRIEDIDTPETHEPKCIQEASLGAQATRRLLNLLNEGPFELVQAADRDEDKYGRKLRTVMRDGRSLGQILVAEGLARTWTGRRLPWCG